jgi:hypothetical protein
MSDEKITELENAYFDAGNKLQNVAAQFASEHTDLLEVMIEQGCTCARAFVDAMDEFMERWHELDEAEIDAEVASVEIPDDLEGIEAAAAASDARKRIWAVWNSLPETTLSPVHTIANELGLTTAEVAAVVFPPEEFGEWADDQEPT